MGRRLRRGSKISATAAPPGSDVCAQGVRSYAALRLRLQV
jgi:hypothetical protein